MTRERGRLWLACLALCLVGAIASPFQMGEYTFLNFRLASLSYFFLGALAGAVRLTGVPAAASVALMAVLLVGSVEKQRHISGEIQEILPVVEAMAPNANVLPLVFERSSPELDPTYFDMHLHAADYYHILRGGGLGPYFLKASIHPVHLRPDVILPNPGEYQPFLFNWEQHADHYQYFLVRHAPPGFDSYIRDHTDLVTQNGEWQLFQRR